MPRIIEGERCNLVGERVRYYRKKKKYSQKLLSEKLETMAIYICRGSISRIEDGSRTVTDIELYGLASILRVSIEDLFPHIDI
ncbi:MAG: helix-turn-helix transcriptional regulator [Lachnospiraceae bacterium]|nr:helix-turn-helix transcriptional regulator [Lachnospiraceae bacterium]